MFGLNFSHFPQHDWSVILVFCGPQGPFFESTDCDRSDVCGFALFDRFEKILPVFDLAWINARLLTSSLLYQKTIGPTLSGNPYDLP